MEGIKITENKQESGIELWNDPEVRTITIYRHGEWKTDHAKAPVGSITPEGIEGTKIKADSLVKKIPEDALVEIFESPSFMFAKLRSKNKIAVRPQRSRQTASIYEAKIFGNIASTKKEKGVQKKDDAGNPISGRRLEDKLLGDFFESATEETAAYIEDFFKLRTELYSDDLRRFWYDFETNNLPNNLREALYKAGGSDSLRLAKNIISFIKQLEKNQEDDFEDNKKEIDIAISHGETIGSFLHYLGVFLKDEGYDEENINEVLEGEIDFNEGFDLHKKGAKITLIKNGKSIIFDLEKFKDFIDKLNV